MSKIVLDTDVWSFLFKLDTRAEHYRPHLEGHVFCVSFQTVAELYQWAEKANWQPVNAHLYLQSAFPSIEAYISRPSKIHFRLPQTAC